MLKEFIKGAGKPLLKTVIVVIAVIHISGSFISYFVFSHRFAREHTFGIWLIFGDYVPVVKATFWEVFLPIELSLAKGKNDNPMRERKLRQQLDQVRDFSEVYQELPWIQDFHIFVERLKAIKDSTLHFYSPNEKPPRFDLYVSNMGYLILESSIMAKSTGLTVNIIIRDKNIDGKADDFKFDGSDKESYDLEFKGALSDDGFYILDERKAEHQAIILSWIMMITRAVMRMNLGE